MCIDSPKNAAVQALRHAMGAGQPLKSGLIAAEGPRLLEEALRGRWLIEEVWTTPTGRERYRALLERVPTRIVEVSARVFQSLSGSGQAQEVLALMRRHEWSWEEMDSAKPLIVVLDGIQDPGNAGTIVRSAEAFGATGAVFLPRTVGIANGKFLRASAGSIFRLPVIDGISSSYLLNLFEQSGIKRYALTARAGACLPEADFRAGVALVVGTEGSGVSPELLRAAEGISIPTGEVESLNAAVACSIALFEAARQRGWP
ncbi:MAG: TrmH family RNA methyltransferase [Bryobacteraceae bacterium]